ncbi:uncharacterized protein [Apostichopus japonicus]
MSFWSPCKQRIRRLMGSEGVKLTNGKFMDKLALKVKEEYEHDLAKREEELALGEIRREKELVLKGILDTPYQPRKRHPVTKQVMTGNQPRKRSQTKPACKSVRKKGRNSADKGPSKSQQSFEDGNLRGHASQLHKRTFNTSTFGDVFQRLTSQWTVRPSQKESPVCYQRTPSKSLDGNIANSKSDHSSNDRKRRKNSKRRKRGRRSSKNNKLTRKLFRVRSIGPTNLVSDDAEDNHIVDQSEQTLIKQLKEDLFI